MAQSNWPAQHGEGSWPNTADAAERWAGLRSFLLERYFTLDRRSLGLFRIVFGVLLLSDLCYRARGIQYWYVNDGLMPNHVVLWAKPTGPLLSLFFTLSSYQEAVIGFLICGLVFVSYTLGYRTKLSQALAFVCILSLNGRLHMLENGGDIVVNILACLTLFLPLGDRFSFDALRLARARGVSASATEATQPFVSMACFALIVQLALIYLFNVLHKSGASWMEGSAVHYTLHQDRLITSFGVWLRETMPYPVLQALTWGTLAVESLAVVLLLSPCQTLAGRALAVLLLPSLHLGFALCLDLGPFPYVMMCFFIPLIPAWVWQRLAEQRCLTPLRRILTRTRRRLQGVVQQLEPEVQTVQVNPPGDSLLSLWPREMAATVVLLSILFAVSQTNAAVPAPLRLGYPPFARSIIDSTRMFQGWRMFAPEAPFEDFAITVDAITADGRHVDPYNEVASPHHPRVLHDIPTRLGQDQYFTSYSLFLPNDNFKGYHHILQSWVLDYPKRTGHANDRIVSFTVKQIIDTSPPPGQTQPSNIRVRELFRYPAD
jgi:hypothetical protein